MMEMDPVGKESERFYGNVDAPDGAYIGKVDGKPRLEFDHANENIDVHGTLEYADDSLLWDDLQVNIAGVRLPASGAPTWTAYKGGFILSFSKSADNKIYFTAQLPHSYKEGSEIEFHIHTVYPSASAGDVRWNFTYSWANIGAAYPAETTETKDIASPNEADTHQYEDIADMAGAGKEISSMLICSLEREGSDAVNDDYDDVVYLIALDFHFQKDTNGSREEAEK